MKKHLMMLLSWTMLMAGVASFASCSDDDEEEGTEMFDKYGDNKGVTTSGDDIIVSTTAQGNGEIIVYHFDGEKLTGGTYYIKFANETLAKEAYNQAKQKKQADVKIDGTVVSASVPVDDYEDFADLSKSEIVDFLGMLYK